jgi:predicted permease
MQGRYRQALIILSVLVALVLMIACANVANLMSARSISRAREMALRVAIGAGRRRLVQLVLLESALIAMAAAVIGAVFAWLSAPLIVGMIDLPSGPARLALPLEWRLIGFGLGLTLAVTVLFGLTAALRASAVRPVEALKGGRDPHGRRSLMSGLVGVQVAFCVVVLFVAALFVTTFERLANQPVGYSAERLLAVETVATQPRTPVYWSQVAAHVLAVPGVESVSLAGWPLMSGQAQAIPVSVNGGPLSEEPAYVLSISPGWIDTMKIPLIEGRDFRANEMHPSVALVNVDFAKTYFHGGNPVGSSFEQPVGPGQLRRVEVVGMVGNAKYDSMREPVKPTIYVPFGSINGVGEPRSYGRASLIVRTSTKNPLALAETIRREVPQARSEFYATNITTQQDLNDSHTVRERLLATLGFFFATVALILSSVGVYGVLHYSVVQRQREIGICIALGARAVQVARRVVTAVVSAVFLGSILGLAVAIAIERYIENLLWGVKGAEPAMLAVPTLSILATLLAAAPVLLRAVRIDPAELLRTD